MNRLIRAEWYRVSKTYHLMLWTIIFCLFITYIGYMNVGFDSVETGLTAFDIFMENGMLLVMYIPMFIGGMYVSSYENKILSYEIMAGNTPSKIILSKLLTIVPLVAVISILLIFSPVVFFGVKNGYGDTKFLWAKLLIVSILCIRVVSCAVLIMTTFKSTIGMFIVFLRFLVMEGIGLMIIEAMADSGNLIGDATLCLVQGGISNAMVPSISDKHIIICVVSSVVEMIIWYMLSYNSYKKRWFN